MAYILIDLFGDEEEVCENLLCKKKEETDLREEIDYTKQTSLTIIDIHGNVVDL